MGLHLREAGMTYRIAVGDSRPNMAFVELYGDGSRPLLQLRADLRGPSRNPRKDVRLYVVVRMTPQEMADLLPHRAERATSAENVQMWGIYVQSTAVSGGRIPQTDARRPRSGGREAQQSSSRWPDRDHPITSEPCRLDSKVHGRDARQRASQRTRRMSLNNCSGSVKLGCWWG